jgi:hypothetical protein
VIKGVEKQHMGERKGLNNDGKQASKNKSKPLFSRGKALMLH